MVYIIYKITSPSGKFYIGLSKQDVNTRWGQHKRRAKKENRNHPFYNAIRKYGPSAFKVEVVDYAANKEEAQRKEVAWIAKGPIEQLYNVSPGGEADGYAGSKAFWESIKQDTVRYNAYLQKISTSKKQNDWSDYEYMSQKAAEWRRANPREAYKQSHRAIRCAMRATGQIRGSTPDNRPLKEKLMWKFKPKEAKSRQSSINATKVWAERSPEDVIAISDKISSSAKSNWARIKDPAMRSQKTEAARSAIDRTKQGPAASKGLKKFWEELRQDPDRYREYIERRTRSLNAAKKRKKENI